MCLQHSDSQLATVKSQLSDHKQEQFLLHLSQHNLLHLSNTIHRSSAPEFLLPAPFNQRHQAKINHLTSPETCCPSPLFLAYLALCPRNCSFSEMHIGNRTTKWDSWLLQRHNREPEKQGCTETAPMASINRGRNTFIFFTRSFISWKCSRYF